MGPEVEQAANFRKLLTPCVDEGLQNLQMLLTTPGLDKKLQLGVWMEADAETQNC